MTAEHAESGNFDGGVSRVSDGAQRNVWAEISVQNAPGGVGSGSREFSSFSAGIGGTADATISADFITFAGTKTGSDFAQRNDGVITDSTREGSKFSGQRTDFPDGSAKATVADFGSVTDVEIGPDGQLKGIGVLKNDGRPTSHESGDELKDKFVPNMGPDGKPDGTSSYTTPEGVRIDKGNCGEVTSVSRQGQTVYSREGSQCLS